MDGKRLISFHSVKHLGVLFDVHLSWNEQVYQIKVKINRFIGILIKLVVMQTKIIYELHIIQSFSFILNTVYNNGSGY